jgi:hypothetical protein
VLLLKLVQFIHSDGGLSHSLVLRLGGSERVTVVQFVVSSIEEKV